MIPRLLTLALAVALPVLAASAAPDPELLASIESSLRSAATYLGAAQDEDGAWRSGHYAFLRDGLGITPIAVTCMHVLSQYGFAPIEVPRRGADFLVLAARTNGAALDYPVYTAAASSWAVVLGQRTEETLAAQSAWLSCLRTLQLGPDLGWTTNDTYFGGWGYNPRSPQRPAEGAPGPYTANLSATLFAVGALRAVNASDPALQHARTFARRCQNADGGFCFNPLDAASNKAGAEDESDADHPRFRSYGTATADGVRILLACGVAADDPDIQRARDWLVANFNATMIAGEFPAERIALRESYYFYYAWTLAHALHVLRDGEVQISGEKLHWAIPLARELIRRQSPDGSWINAWTDAREDDPLVATPLAASALAVCRKALLAHDLPLEFPAHGSRTP